MVKTELFKEKISGKLSEREDMVAYTIKRGFLVFIFNVTHFDQISTIQTNELYRLGQEGRKNGSKNRTLNNRDISTNIPFLERLTHIDKYQWTFIIGHTRTSAIIV